MYLSNTTIMEMASEFYNNEINNWGYYISPLDAEGRTLIRDDPYRGPLVILKGSTDPNLMETGDLDLVVFFNSDATEIVEILPVDDAERCFAQRVCRLAVPELEDWNGVRADDLAVTMEQVLAATTVRIYYSNWNVPQLETALRELFCNGFLNFEETESGSHLYHFTDGVNGHETELVEYDEDPDDYRASIYTSNDLDIQVITPGWKPEGNDWRIVHKRHTADAGATNWGGAIQITFAPDTYGYWTRPGTLVFRALGQGLRVEIPKA